MRRLLPIVLFLVACANAPDPGPTPRCPTTKALPGDVTVFASGLRGTEGIAFSPEGRLFVSAGDHVLEVKPDGSHANFADVPKTVGLAWWGDALYVASGDDGTHAEGQFCAETRRGAVWKVTKDGQASVFATGIRAPNFIAVTPWNSLVVSDDCATNLNVYEVDHDGHVTTFLDNVPSANGLAFDAAGTTLFAASTFVNPPNLWKIAIGADHRPGAPAKLATYGDGVTPDGLTVDADGALYASLNTAGEIHRIAPDGTEALFANGVMTTASLAFGAGAGFDACTIYSTSLLGDDLYAVYVGVPGLALRR